MYGGDVMVISVVGLGKLGACLAAAIADRGFGVIGIDVNRSFVNAINSGMAPVLEPQLQDYIERNQERLSATSEYRDAILTSDITFVIVPTPSIENGSFSVEYARSAFAAIGKVLKEKDRYHLVVLTSTVLPGDTREHLIPVLERGSQKKCGRDFGVCYSPEFIALGSVIRDFLNPDFLLIGEFDTKSGDVLEEFYRAVIGNSAVVKRMTIENAELAKISLNSYVTMKITFSNLIAKICERIPNGNADIVSDAIGTDSRIGRKYLTGGLGFGGTCFPRDNIAFAKFAQSLNVPVDLPNAIVKFNNNIPNRYAEKIAGIVKPGSTIALLGLAYKPNSPIVEESQAIALAKVLFSKGYTLVGYDPLANENALREMNGGIEIMDSVHDCLAVADAVLITTPDAAFAGLKAADFANGKKEVIVMDFWRLLIKELANKPGIRYIPVGYGKRKK